jgi:hypothetical protein
MLKRLLLVLSILLLCPHILSAAQLIDRKALVTRHNPVLHQLDAKAPLTGAMAASLSELEITGTADFWDYYASQWHSCGPLSPAGPGTRSRTNHYKLSVTNQDYTLPEGRTLDSLSA